MKIVYDVSYIQRRRAGMGRYAADLLGAILEADRENEYQLFGWSFSLDGPEIARHRRPNVSVRTARIPGPVKRYYWTRMDRPKLRSIVGSFDVFHSADPLLPPLAGERGVITVYDLAYRRYPELFEHYVLRLDPYVRQSIRRAAAIIVPSEFTRADLLDAGEVDEQRVHVIHPPVLRRGEEGYIGDPEILRRFQLAPSFVLAVGTIEPRKNHPRLIRAFELAAEEEPGLQLVIAGKLGWHYGESIGAMKSSPLASRIRYLEYVSDAERDALYRSAACVVYPSLFEGCGLPVLEAMAAGTPVITSDGSAMKEVARDAALLVNPEDPGEIAAALTRVLRDSELARELSRKGAERVGDFSAPSAAQKVLALYRSLA